MELHDLKRRPGAKKERTRVGRGRASGKGKTAGRGTKGYGARSGSGGKLYFQGGNLPFFRRLPFKRGFTNVNRPSWQELNLDQLSDFGAEEEVSPETLLEAGLIDDLEHPVVILGMGEVAQPLKLRVHRISKSAQKKVEKAGGSVEIIEE
ncbi:MAG: 50S ribosomal protein L15 [Anaerolineales bacterium]